MSFDWGVLYTIGKIFLKAIRYFPCIFKIDLIWEKYEHPKILDNKNPKEKWHLNVIPTEKVDSIL
jgi:hypothetical protein